MEKEEKIASAVMEARNSRKKNGYLAVDGFWDIADSHSLSEKEAEEALLRLAKEGIKPQVRLDEGPVNKAANDSLSLYYSQMGKYPLLNEEKMDECARKVREIPLLEAALKANGDDQETKQKLEEAKRSKDEMILANLRLVVSIAKKYGDYAHSTPLIDLIQEGNIGLEKAVSRFDPDKGVCFSTYAYYWIRQSIIGYLNGDSRLIHIPTRALSNLRLVQKTIDELSQNLGREPSINEISCQSGLSIEQVSECLSLPLNLLSIDAPIDQDGDDFASFIASDDEEKSKSEIERKEDDVAVQDAINRLTEREKDIVVRNFGLNGEEPESLEAIGKSYGITRERARQIREKALIKMRKGIKR